jgi:hypothetical protein
LQSSIAAHGQSGLYLLFPSGERPDARAIAVALAAQPRAAISHDPRAAGGEGNWLELLIDGITFDLTGLAPGDQIEDAQYTFRFDCPPDLLETRHEALRVAPGPHIADGAGMLPIVRGHAALGALLAGVLDRVSAVGWAPAASLMGVGYFRSVIDAWLGGGPFPALALTAFRPTIDDGLQSVGLAYLTGQEVRLEPPLVADRTAATRLGVRLVNLLVSAGRLEKPDLVTGPDGATLRLEPSPNGRFVRVFPG